MNWNEFIEFISSILYLYIAWLTCKGIFHAIGKWEYTTKHLSVI